ncbi:MAG: SH3 domain-containing protein [Pseudomonadota bacterium]
MNVKRPVIRCTAAAVLLLAAASSHAFDFKSVGANPAILYDAPSVKGTKLFVAPRGMPVEVVLSYGEWVKVRDVNGDMAWIAANALSPKRNVIAKVAGVKLRASADEAAAALTLLDKGVLLELVEPDTAGWVKVHHRDGITGFVKASEVWGI